MDYKVIDSEHDDYEKEIVVTETKSVDRKISVRELTERYKNAVSEIERKTEEIATLKLYANEIVEELKKIKDGVPEVNVGDIPEKLI